MMERAIDFDTAQALNDAWYRTDGGLPRYPHITRLTPFIAEIIEADVDEYFRMPWPDAIDKAYRIALSFDLEIN